MFRCPFQFCNHLDGGKWANSYTLFVSQVSCDWYCSLTLPFVSRVGLQCVIGVILIILTCSLCDIGKQ